MKKLVDNFYDEVSDLTWRAGLDPDSESDRFKAFLSVAVGNPLPIKRLGKNDLDQMGLRPFVKNSKVNFDEVNAYRKEKGLNEIRLGVHVDENA